MQQDELCQDDMSSLAELLVVEDQSEKVLVETTICTVSVASISKQCYDMALYYSKGSVTYLS